APHANALPGCATTRTVYWTANVIDNHKRVRSKRKSGFAGCPRLLHVVLALCLSLAHTLPMSRPRRRGHRVGEVWTCPEQFAVRKESCELLASSYELVLSVNLRALCASCLRGKN